MRELEVTIDRMPVTVDRTDRATYLQHCANKLAYTYEQLAAYTDRLESVDITQATFEDQFADLHAEYETVLQRIEQVRPDNRQQTYRYSTGPQRQDLNDAIDHINDLQAAYDAALSDIANTGVTVDADGTLLPDTGQPYAEDFQ